MDMKSCLQYWGKAQSQDPLAPDHPLVFHSLDVAACAFAFLQRNPSLERQIADWLKIDADAARNVLTFLVAVHDIGKFSESFQYKVPEAVARRFEVPPQRLAGSLHHDAIGSLFFAWLVEGPGLPPSMRYWGADDWGILLDASFGHHGRPPPELPLGRGAALVGLRNVMSAQSREAARCFFGWCADFFLPRALPRFQEEGGRIASWWIAGLSVLADWIGSNTTWFPYAGEKQRNMSLPQYWECCALRQARRAIAEAGVVPVRPRRYKTVDGLLPGLRNKALRPAQQLVADLELPAEPQVIVLEDATGSGKTEAALILAGRLIDSGLADGLFFGLPTQATADQMFERVAADLPQWFDDPSSATLVLAHGARDQSHAFLRHLAQVNDEIPGESDTAMLRLTDWLAQSNKRALLAQIGVGTIDQALLAGLRTRHQSLRILGLFRKVLIVDEVHSYDPYMTGILLQTLKLHAAAGGSAILLSATLPGRLRSRLLAAFAEGIACSRKAVTETAGVQRRSRSRHVIEPLGSGYPMLTHWFPSVRTRPREIRFEAAAHSRRSIAIDYVSTEKDVLRYVDSWRDAGQAVVWIRNTVSDACAAWSRLVERFGADRCILFHARFAGVDRRRIQNEVLEALGSRSDAAARRGRIIVTTQVLQESLDVDADQMICDLCPVDVLLQRIGRYRRHLRDASGDRLPDDAARDGRKPGAVVVFGPDRDVEPSADWYARFSRGSARVYAAHGRIYLSARVIGTNIELPRQYRELVEAVYGEDAHSIPTALQTAEDRALGQDMAGNALADLNAVALPGGYRSADWSSEEHVGSRLGDSVEAVLARQSGNVLEPWALGRCSQGEDAWALSAVRVPGFWLRGCSDPPAYENEHVGKLVEALKASCPALKYRLVVPLSPGPKGTWSCVLGGDVPVWLMYSEEFGLQRALK